MVRGGHWRSDAVPLQKRHCKARASAVNALSLISRRRRRMSSHPFRASTVVPLLLLGAAIIASFMASSGPVQWMDNGMFLASASEGPYFSPSLGPLEHPFYQLINAVVFTLFGARPLSLLNSILLLPLAWIIYRLARNVGASARQAVLAGVATILAHGVFWVSTKAEVYLLHTLFVLLAYALYFSADTRLGALKKLLVIGILTGLAASIHQLTFVVLLPLYLHMLYQHKARILITLPGFVLGFAAAAVAVINDLNAGLGLLDIARRYLTGASATVAGPEWESSLLRFDAVWREKNAVALLLIGPQLIGLVMFPRDNRLRLLWSAALLNLLFALSYNVTDRFTFFLPGVALLSVIGMIQLRALLPRHAARGAVLNLSVLSSPLAMLLAYSLYASGVIRLPLHKEALPLRDDIHYFMVPYLRDRSAEQFVRAYQEFVPDGALIIADWTPMGALRSAQTVGLLRGRRLATCDENVDVRTDTGVYLVRLSYCATIAGDFRLEEQPVGYALHRK
ncbi:putative membrane protein [Pseudomonas cannabina]|uniref:Membrane protein n=3 Tax=Pseudomonas cannabina TaxID=86840 RepID=A0AB37QGJ8_PSECA|nr:putative membrane protein [Pseudomonas cannabina]